jgi:hypothetical protein
MFPLTSSKLLNLRLVFVLLLVCIDNDANLVCVLSICVVMLVLKLVPYLYYSSFFILLYMLVAFRSIAMNCSKILILI